MNVSPARFRLGERGLYILIGVCLALAVPFLVWVMFTESLKSGLINTLAISLVFALPMLFLTVMLTPMMERRIDTLRPPWDWAAFLVAIMGSSFVSIMISDGITVSTGLIPPSNAGRQLGFMNRLSFSMMLLFTIAGRLVMVTKNRLEERNRALQEKIAAGTRERQVLDQDMSRAWEIQQALFPKELPKVDGCEIAAGCQPARVVGGDYFDVIRLKNGRIGIAIADVVGKGMAAALLMSNLQAIVRSFAPSGIAAAELCAKANEVIAGNIAPGKFITFFYAVIDGGEMQAEYCNAGHNPPLLVRSDGEIEFLREGGPLLGVLPEATYESGRVRLGSGDRLVFFTDGITEAANFDQEEFGEDRLIRAVKNSDGKAEVIRQAIMAEVGAFAGDSLQDDATLVVLVTTQRAAKAARA